LSRNLRNVAVYCSTSGQKAVLALEVEKHLAVEAKERQGSRNDLLLPNIPQIFAECSGDTNEQKDAKENKESRQQAAVIVGTNRQYVSDAKRIQRDAPELLERVKDGSLPIHEMAKRPSS